MGNNNIIDNKNAGIVVTETKVTISNEKLKGLLLKAYEEALKDSHRFRIHDLWGICWSIVGTLVITFLTSDFNPVFGLESEKVKIIAIIICLIFALAGIWLTIWRVRKKTEMDTDSRDKAVDRIANECLK